MADKAQAKTFALVCRIASISTVVLALTDIILNTVLMCFHTCAIEVNFPISDAIDYGYDFFFLFYTNYLADETCKYNNVNGTVVPTFAECDPTAGSKFGITYTPPSEVTSADGAFIWVIVLLVLDCLWLVTAIVMELDFGGERGGKAKKIMFWPWVVMTMLVLLYGFIAFIVFMVDLQYPMDIDCEKYQFQVDFVSNWLTSVFVFPMFFFRGGIVWIAILLLLVKVIIEGMRSEKAKKGPQNLFTPQKTISEMVEEVEEEKIEPKIVAPAEDKVDALPVIVPIRGLPPVQHSEIRRLSNHMVYANEAFEPDPVIPVHRVSSRRRKVSDPMSDFSEADPRKIGRPVSQPLDARNEHAIPRARLDSSVRESRSGKTAAIITPSGKSVRASDYLKDQRYDNDLPAPVKEETGYYGGYQGGYKGGYQAPSQNGYKQGYQPPNPGNRYMVKLKD